MGIPEVKFHFFPLLSGQSDPNGCKDRIVMPSESINAKQGNFYIRPEQLKHTNTSISVFAGGWQ